MQASVLSSFSVLPTHGSNPSTSSNCIPSFSDGDILSYFGSDTWQETSLSPRSYSPPGPYFGPESVRSFTRLPDRIPMPTLHNAGSARTGDAHCFVPLPQSDPPSSAAFLSSPHLRDAPLPPPDPCSSVVSHLSSHLRTPLCQDAKGVWRHYSASDAASDSASTAAAGSVHDRPGTVLRTAFGTRAHSYMPLDHSYLALDHSAAKDTPGANTTRTNTNPGANATRANTTPFANSPPGANAPGANTTRTNTTPFANSPPGANTPGAISARANTTPGANTIRVIATPGANATGLNATPGCGSALPGRSHSSRADANSAMRSSPGMRLAPSLAFGSSLRDCSAGRGTPAGTTPRHAPCHVRDAALVARYPSERYPSEQYPSGRYPSGRSPFAGAHGDLRSLVSSPGGSPSRASRSFEVCSSVDVRSSVDVCSSADVRSSFNLRSSFDAGRHLVESCARRRSATRRSESSGGSGGVLKGGTHGHPTSPTLRENSLRVRATTVAMQTLAGKPVPASAQASAGAAGSKGGYTGGEAAAISGGEVPAQDTQWGSVTHASVRARSALLEAGQDKGMRQASERNRLFNILDTEQASAGIANGCNSIGVDDFNRARRQALTSSADRLCREISLEERKGAVREKLVRSL